MATSMDMNCDVKIPKIRPIIRDIIPTNIVSINSIFDICLLLIPRVMYIPNSFFLLFIKKLLAYTINKPRITAIKIDTMFSMLIISFIICLVELDTWSMAS